MTLAGCPPRSPQAPENDKKPGSLVHDFRAFRYVIVSLTDKYKISMTTCYLFL